MWCRLERTSEDPQQRTFELDVNEEPTVVNSTELRFTDIEMERVRSVGAHVTVVRRSLRAGARLVQ